MAETISAEIISAVLQMKRMTREQWRTSQYVPREGEPVCESDTGFMKVGDGTHRFPDLRYLTGPQGPQGIQGVQGPPGRDGVVTFENLSQTQRNSLKGDRGERGEQGPTGPAGPTGERGHSLTANVRIEGNYRNGVNSQLNIIADVYYDGTRLNDGYTVDFYYRGFGSDNWTSQLNQSPDSNGRIAHFSSAQRSGGYLEVYIVVTYQGIKVAASTRLDNVQDGARGADGVVNYASTAAQEALSVYAKKAETPIYRIAKGDIPGSGVGTTATIQTSDLMNPDGVKVGDIIQDFYSSVYGADEGWWKVTNVNNTSISVTGIGTRRLYTPYNDADIKRRLTALEGRPSFDSLTEQQRESLRGPAGQPGQNIINQKTGQPMKYWMGSKAEFDAIRNKDAGTVYDYYE